MNYQLTITGTREEIAAFLAGSTALTPATINGTMTAAGAINGNGATIDHQPDDESGPALSNATHDSAGIPWDERIHSKNKGTNADGTWRKKRGVSAAEVATVEGELKARAAQGAGMYMPQPGAMPPNGGQPQYQPQPGQMPQNHTFPPQPQQQPMPQNPTFTPPPQPQFQPQPGMDFNGFMQHLAGQMQKRGADGHPLIDVNYLALVTNHLSQMFQRPLNSITDIVNDPNLIAAAIAKITQDGRWN